MAWIKRHLFFVLGGIVAFALLGAAGYYDYQTWNHNSDELAKLHEIYTKLGQLTNQKPAPSEENIELARSQEAQVRDWVKQAITHFQPIASIPDPGTDGVNSEVLGATLRNTIIQLQHEAEAANVAIPAKYNFSFEAEAGSRQMIMKFAPGSLSDLPVQLGEVKVISEIIFGAHVNALDGIQRVRVSDDDAGCPKSDYLPSSSVTNGLAVITPYTVQFRCFTPELAGVLASFATSPNGFVVSNVNVQQAAGALNDAGADAAARAIRVVSGVPGAPKNLSIVLKEQLLRVTLEVKIVKLLLK